MIKLATRDDQDPETAGPARRHSRRLEDKVLAAFHHACDLTDLEVADSMLRVLETMVARQSAEGDGQRRRVLDGIVAAHERLWHIRHPVEPN